MKVRKTKLQKKLERWSSDIRSKSDKTPPQRLYHYTGLQAFSAILSSNQFWMTCYKNLDDPTEFVYSEKLIEESLADHEAKFDPAELYVLRQFLGFLEGREPKVSTFVLSFSEDCDSLYQWRAYSDDGNGVCIGIEPPTHGDRYFRNLSRVIYDADEQRMIMNRLIEQYLHLYEEYKDDEDNAAKDAFELYRAIMNVRPSFKHDAYRIEKEWRYANYPMEHQTLYRWDKRGKIEYFAEERIRDDNELLPIREIWLGPRVDNESGTETVKALLKQSGYDLDSIKICHSTIPLR